MAQSDKYADWLPMGEVIKRTGMSERTVYRMVTEGKLLQGQRPIPGRRPLSVFDPGGVAELEAATLKQNPQVLAPAGTSSLALLADAFRAAQPPDDASNTLPPSELRHKLYLTDEEAVAYTGLGKGYLRAHAEGKAIGPRGTYVYRRVDLDQLAEPEKAQGARE